MSTLIANNANQMLANRPIQVIMPQVGHNGKIVAIVLLSAGACGLWYFFIADSFIGKFAGAVTGTVDNLLHPQKGIDKAAQNLVECNKRGGSQFRKTACNYNATSALTGGLGIGVPGFLTKLF
jgi:hypothetical protein